MAAAEPEVDLSGSQQSDAKYEDKGYTSEVCIQIWALLKKVHALAAKPSP